MARTITVARLRIPVVADPRGVKRGFAAALGHARKFSRMLRSIAKVAAVGLAVITTATVGLAAGLRKLAKDAAPLPGIMQAFRNQAARSGLSLDKMREAAQGTITDMELMRQANIALTGAGDQLAKAFGRDLPRLLEGARAAAQAQGKSVEFMFDSIVNGVKRATPKLIDNTGLVVKLGEVNQKWSDAMDVSVENMTAQQQSLAILEATIGGVNRLLEETGGLTLTSAQRAARVGVAFQNWAHQAGLVLLPAMDSVNDALYKLINDVGPAVVSLFRTQIGPGVAALADIFAEMAEKAVETGTDLVNKYGKKLERMAFDALKWGIEVSSQFAIGLIRGASTAIVMAMKYIGKLLTFWMGPGSPPRIAPDVDQWGLNIAAELLRGFAEAEFDVLEGFQTKLESALSALVGAGSLATGKASKMFHDLSLQMTRALDEFKRTSNLPVALFERLRQTGGRLGVELSKLARLQFKLAEATERYRKAEERLRAAQERRDDSQHDLTRIMREYNKLLEEGASKAELAAKRAEFLAAKDRLRTAEDEILAAEKQVDLAEEGLDPLQKQLGLQERLLDQLTRLLDQQAKLTKEKEAGEGLLFAPPEPPIPSVPDTSALENAFNEAKERIRAALEEAFAPLAEVFAEVQTAADNVSKGWGKLQEAFDTFWSHPSVVAVREWFTKTFGKITVQDIGKVAGQIVILVGGIGLLSVAAGLATSPLVLLAGALLILNKMIERNKPQLETTTNQLGVLLVIALQSAITTLNQLGFIIGQTFTKSGNKIKTWWDEDVKWRLEEFAEWLKTDIPDAAEDLVTAIEEKFESVKTAITEKLEPIQTAIDDVIESFEWWWDTLKRFWEWLQDKVFKIKIELPEVPKWAQPKSPLPIHTAWKNFAKDMRTFSRDMPALATAGAQTNVDRSMHRVNYNNLTVHTRATQSTYLQDYHTAVALAR